MLDFLTVLAVALLPVGGNLLGAGMAELTRAPRWVTGAALHAAAGVAIAVVSVDLTPRVFDTTSAWVAVLLFAIGGALAALLAGFVGRLRGGASPGTTGAWMVYMATAIDLFSDGLMTGASSAVSLQLGALLGLSQVVGNVPGGFATVANLRIHGVPLRSRLLAAGSFVLPVVLAATVRYWLLRGRSENL